MAIIVNEAEGRITLQTRHSAYQMEIDDKGNLIHTYYGSPIHDCSLYGQLRLMDRGFCGNPYEVGAEDRTYSLDVLPQEYSCFGTGDFRITGLRVRESAGDQTAALHYESCRVTDGLYGIEGLPAVYEEEPRSKSLCIRMKDACSGLVAELWYGVLEEQDVIVRSTRLVNEGDAVLQIEKAASLCLDFPYGEFDWITLHGRHAMERNVTRRRIPHGISAVGSVRGISSHQYHPFSILCEPSATETAGKCYGFSFLYSGDFLMEVEKDQVDQTRFLCGIHPDEFSWSLGAGEELALPQVMMSYSAEGLGQLSRNYHRTVRENVCRGPWKHRRRPVLINNWEATYFDFTGEKLAAIAKEAHDLGIDLFVMDDGWFGRRDSDNCALGDWYPNEEKLGCTLKSLAERITAEGMLFGIWFEPEAISVDSDLYREHPDWTIAAPGRRPCLSRNQLVLDFSRTEVCDYILERMCAVLRSAPIGYVKWDMNRSICDKYSPALDAQHQGEFSHRYILGLYHVLEELHRRFPEVLIEGCSGGGGRFDAGMLYYTPQIWTSDNTDALNRVSIQYGTSLGYPISSMGAHVSAVPNHQTGRVTPLHTRGCVAMAGTFGYELDITRMTPEEKEEVKEQIRTFQSFYELLQYGEYYRLSGPDAPCTAWEMVSPDQEEALLTAVYHGVEGNQCPYHVTVPGLRGDVLYQIERVGAAAGTPESEKVLLPGDALAGAGLLLPIAHTDNEAVQLHIKAV